MPHLVLLLLLQLCPGLLQLLLPVLYILHSLYTTQGHVLGQANTELTMCDCGLQLQRG